MEPWIELLDRAIGSSYWIEQLLPPHAAWASSTCEYLYDMFV